MVKDSFASQDVAQLLVRGKEHPATFTVFMLLEPKITVVKVEISPWCCRNFTVVAFPLHHGGVLTAPWWSFYGTMVEWHRHRGVFPDFTMVKIFLHHGVFSKSRGEMISPWWRNFELGLKAF